MKAKKIIAAFLAAVTILGLLTACGDSSSGSDSSGSSVSSSGSSKEETKITEYDTTVFTASIPDGWTAVPVPDMLKKFDGKTNPEQLYVIKGGQTSDDIMKFPYIWVNYYKDAKVYASAKSMYENAQDISVPIGSENWEGYTYTSSGYPGCCLTYKQGDSLWVCLFVLENGDKSISVDDKDVESILSSLKAKNEKSGGNENESK